MNSPNQLQALIWLSMGVTGLLCALATSRAHHGLLNILSGDKLQPLTRKAAERAVRPLLGYRGNCLLLALMSCAFGAFSLSYEWRPKEILQHDWLLFWGSLGVQALYWFALCYGPPFPDAEEVKAGPDLKEQLRRTQIIPFALLYSIFTFLFVGDELDSGLWLLVLAVAVQGAVAFGVLKAYGTLPLTPQRKVGRLAMLLSAPLCAAILCLAWSSATPT
jgi:hypothetical protein